MDLELHSQLESQLVDLIDFASQIARAKEEETSKRTLLDASLKDAQNEIERIKRERLDDRETRLAQERKTAEEKANLSVELEKLRVKNGELEAKCESYRAQNEALQVSLTKLQNGSSSSLNSASMGQNSAGNRLSNIVNKEIIDQITNLHEFLKQLENRTSAVAANTVQAEARASDISKVLKEAEDLVTRSKAQQEQLRHELKNALTKIRANAVTISSKTLDVESLQEQVNRFREEIATLNQHRRNLEAELEHTKLMIATTFAPLCEAAKQADHQQLFVEQKPEEKASAETPAQKSLELVPLAEQALSLVQDQPVMEPSPFMPSVVAEDVQPRDLMEEKDPQTALTICDQPTTESVINNDIPAKSC